MIIGITGTIGAGKGTVVDYLVQTKGFTHYSVREFLMEEIEKRGLPLNRDSMREVANAIRTEHGSSYIVEELFKRAQEADNVLIESIRTVGESDFLKEHGAIMLAVDADRRLRYERIHIRGSVTDNVDYETFVEQEKKELLSTDPNGQNLIAVIESADLYIENDGTVDELHQNIDELFKDI